MVNAKATIVAKAERVSSLTLVQKHPKVLLPALRLRGGRLTYQEQPRNSLRHGLVVLQAQRNRRHTIGSTGNIFHFMTALQHLGDINVTVEFSACRAKVCLNPLCRRLVCGASGLVARNVFANAVAVALNWSAIRTHSRILNRSRRESVPRAR